MSSDNDGLDWKTSDDLGLYKFCKLCKPFVLKELENGLTINKMHGKCNARLSSSHKYGDALTIQLPVIKHGCSKNNVKKIMFTNDSRRKVIKLLTRSPDFT